LAYIKKLIKVVPGNVFYKKDRNVTGIFVQGKVYLISRAIRYKIQEIFYIFLCSWYAEQYTIKTGTFSTRRLFIFIA